VWISVAIMMPWIKNGNVRVFRAKEFTAPHAPRATNHSVNQRRRTRRAFRESPPAAIVSPNSEKHARKSPDKAVTPGPALQEETL
jgi:hypothetical protein